MVDYIQRGSVAVLCVDNPPVNALSIHVRKALKAGIERAEKDGATTAVVIHGARNKFLAGADIKEFKTVYGQGPTLLDLCSQVEACKKPVISAIEGFALGGGLEIAISSHYRIAHSKAVFGFPEVDIGILPGASGTQRFPRLVGLKAALEYIPTGQRFSAAEAKKIDAVDKVVDKDVLEAALTFANEVHRFSLDNRRTSKKAVKDAADAQRLYAVAVERTNRRSPGLLAPTFAIKAVMASLLDSFEKGLEVESSNQLLLATSGQASALQYAFFAQRLASKWSLPDGSTSASTKPKPIRSIGIIGAGTMGTGIAMAALNAGIIVHLVEQNKEFLDKGVKLLKSMFHGSVSRGKLKEEVAKKRLENLRPTLTYETLRDVDMVIEAVYETLKLKREVFSRLEQICRQDTILCTNTSFISIDKIASATKSPERVIGTHFFVPAYYMKLLENVRGQATSPVAIATATAFGQLLGKVPVLVGNCDGFVANRMRRPYGSEAIFLVEEGCSVEQVDQVVEDFGFPIGPFKVNDLSGLDIGVSSLQDTAESLNIKLDVETRLLNGARLSTLPLVLFNNGRLGRKTGAGWYNYERPGAKEPYSSTFIKDLLADYRKKKGIQPRRISTQEIIERLLYSSINEGFKILEEGIATKPEEIDTIWLLGFSWPRQSGGPMYYANSVGLDKIYQKILDYGRQDELSPHWQPSSLLKKLALEGRPMSQWCNDLPITKSRL